MGVYRDAVECAHRRSLDAGVFENTDVFQTTLGIEDGIRGGALWSLKWATEYCPDARSDAPLNQQDLVKAILVGRSYDVLVDALKFAKHNLVTLSVDRESREIICYEGDDLTGFDSEIVEHQQRVGPTHVHASLTEDSDQLTSNWRAGDYRRVCQQLAEYARTQENRIVIDPTYAADFGTGDVSMAQPTLVWLKRPQDTPDVRVFDSLTLPAKMSDQFKWKSMSLLEMPIVKVGGRYCALSSDLKAIACRDECMLRLAARVDENQYSKVSGRRADRMVAACRAAFEGNSQPWHVRSGVQLVKPRQEGDVVASRSSDRLVIELKSTLRPQTAWEVYKRNKEILKGLLQATNLVRRGIASRGLVITDGYRGDYLCWEEALKCGVTIGTLRELDDLARDPNGAVELMKQKAGVIEGKHTVRRLADREAEILGWKLRLIDAAAE